MNSLEVRGSLLKRSHSSLRHSTDLTQFFNSIRYLRGLPVIDSISTRLDSIRFMTDQKIERHHGQHLEPEFLHRETNTY